MTEAHLRASCAGCGGVRCGPPDDTRRALGEQHPKGCGPVKLEEVTH